VTRHIPSFSDNPWFQQILNRVDQFSSQTFGQLLWTDQTVLWDISLLYTGDSIVSGFMMTDLSLSQTGVSQTSWWLLSSILSYQNKFIYGLLNNQELIDAKVCDLTIEHIKNLISQKDVQLIGFIMLTLLLSVFMRSVMFAIGIVNYIILRILFFIGRFSKKKYPEECDHVEL
jgi:hypothetical protein